MFAILLAWGISTLKSRGVPSSFSGLKELGFGHLDSRALVIYDKYDNTPVIALLANMPQLFLAAVYLLYNGCITVMFTSSHWSLLGSRPTAMLVSNPVGKQKSRWWFGSPWAWALPFMGLSMLLHWLCSQSLFLIQIDIYNSLSADELDVFERQLTNAAYSPIAAIVALVTGFLLPALAIVVGLKQLAPGGPPMVCTSSAAISASCHPGSVLRSKPGGDRFWEGELRWGEIPSTVYQNGWGHCSVAPANSWGRDALSPRPGVLFA